MVTVLCSRCQPKARFPSMATHLMDMATALNLGTTAVRQVLSRRTIRRSLALSPSRST